jgi:hypothetical protein
LRRDFGPCGIAPLTSHAASRPIAIKQYPRIATNLCIFSLAAHQQSDKL